MAEQRSDDEIETIDRSVKELDSSGGDVIRGSKVGDEEGLKAPLNVPKFGGWDDSSSDVLSESYATIFSKVREESRRPGGTQINSNISVSGLLMSMESGDDDLDGGYGGGGINDSSSCVASDIYAPSFYKKCQDFGRDTNKHEYFSVRHFNVHGDDDLNGINGYGGGRGTRPRDNGVLEEPKLKHHRGDAGAGTKRGWWKMWFRCWHGRK
ncbi:hypothetical protein E3N88_20569 [Mikania micrantha]|uniref:RIN4 pathogenic type III effector avirulence factor Avr cleavage site domain-containing protein n=1 Tax=Mikania micrantha TaxID=192012 RepID=A0A5N6NHC0_9ASTR|nr:hypothetical protein E3N88_20569 [Mikania micrantha]